MDVEIDKVSLLELAGDDRDSLLLIVEDFRENYHVLLTKAEEAVKGEEFEEVRGFFHQLKGSSGMLGMRSLHMLCTELEAMASGTLELGHIESVKGHADKSYQLARQSLLG